MTGSHSAEWWCNAVIYQVYLRSFQDSDGDGIGDLEGLTARLDYLNDGSENSLGVDAIWLSPISRAGNRDFGYDVIDYEEVDPTSGDLQAFDELVAACHARRIRVILDVVLNHTSDRHPWFLESRAARESPRRDWYIWRDPARDGGPPNNWRSVFGGSMWTLDDATGQYYLHSYFSEQPDVNWRNPEVVAALQDVLRFWLRRGVDGIRIDGAGRLVKDPQFRDEPAALGGPSGESDDQQLSRYTYLHPDLLEALRAIRRVLDEFPERTSIAELYAPPAEFADLYGAPAMDGVHLVFNFQLVRRRPNSPFVPWQADTIAALLRETQETLPPGAQCCYAVSNHDVPRFASRHDHDRLGPARARALPLLLLALPHAVCMYYGDELGLRDTESGTGLGRRDTLGRDAQRSPMPWDGSANRGFTTGAPWLPFGAPELNVASQHPAPDSLLALYRRAIWLRRGEPALLHGTMTVDTQEDVLLVGRHQTAARSIVAAINFTDAERRLSLTSETALLLATDDGVRLLADDQVLLPPLAGAWVTTSAPL